MKCVSMMKTEYTCSDAMTAPSFFCAEKNTCENGLGLILSDVTEVAPFFVGFLISIVIGLRIIMKNILTVIYNRIFRK